MNLTKLIPLAVTVLLAIATAASASLIVKGDVTSNLPDTRFLDDASTGGSDASRGSGASLALARDFDLDGSGLPPGLSGNLTITGFGFATPNGGNTAESVTLTFLYFGDDRIFNTSDDVLLGSETVDWNNGVTGGGWDGAGEYYVPLSNIPTTLIDGLDTRFRVTLTPNNGSLQLKTSQNNNDFSAKISVSGTYAAIPEPTAMLAFGVPATALLLTLRRRRSTAG